nr:hypothetical protein [uncultured Flavobacterium sp.]
MTDLLRKVILLLTNILNGPTLQNFRTITANGTGEVVKAKPGKVYRISAISGAASICYVKLYDKATAATASDTPVATFSLVTAAIGATQVHSFVLPTYFSAGISVRAVTGFADNDNTNPGTAPIIEIQYV